jgi:hypothetical protein
LLTRSYRRVSEIGQQSPIATEWPGLGSAPRPKPPPAFSRVGLLSRAFLPLAQGTGPSQRLGGALANPFGSANDLPVTLALVLGAFHAPIIASWPRAGLLTLGFDPARFQTEPPACYRLAATRTGPTPAGGDELMLIRYSVSNLQKLGALSLVVAGSFEALAVEHVEVDAVGLVGDEEVEGGPDEGEAAVFAGEAAHHFGSAVDFAEGALEQVR